MFATYVVGNVGQHVGIVCASLYTEYLETVKIETKVWSWYDV